MDCHVYNSSSGPFKDCCLYIFPRIFRRPTSSAFRALPINIVCVLRVRVRANCLGNLRIATGKPSLLRGSRFYRRPFVHRSTAYIFHSWREEYEIKSVESDRVVNGRNGDFLLLFFLFDHCTGHLKKSMYAD